MRWRRSRIPESGDKEDGRKQQHPWKCPVPCIFIRTRRRLLSTQYSWRFLPLHTIILVSVFPFKVYHGYYYLVSSVGVSAPSQILLHSPRQMTNFASCWTLYYLGSPELIPPPYKIAHPSSIPFWGFGGYCTHDGGLSLLPDPQHRSFSNRTHSFLSVHFFSQSSCGFLFYGSPLSCQ